MKLLVCVALIGTLSICVPQKCHGDEGVQTASAKSSSRIEWEKRLERCVRSLVKANGRAFFSNSGKLCCEVTYKVSRDGTVSEIQIDRSSGNSEFDRMVVKVVESIQKMEILRFPSDVKEKYIERREILEFNSATDKK